MNFKKNTKPKDFNKKGENEIALNAYLHFLKLEKRFLLLLNMELFHYYQFEVQVLKYYLLCKCFKDFQYQLQK